MTLSNHAVSSLVREKRFGAKSLEYIRKDTDKLLITILIGNNIVNVASASLATIVTLEMASKMNLSPEYGPVIATVVVTIILLLFWEITPKTICTRFNTTISLAVAPIYRVLIVVFSPISFVVGLFLKWVNTIFGWDGYAKQISYQEVEAFIDMSHKEWEVEADERRQIKNLLSLREMTADSVMTPRVNVEFLSMDMTIDEVCDFLLQASHSRMPIYTKSHDDVEYMINFKNAFKLQAEWNGSKKLSELHLEKIMKIPFTQSLDTLFEQFQQSHRHIAVVMDEYGWVAGVITMEDVLEEVFGDIKDETDEEEVYMCKKDEKTIEAVWKVLIDDILEEFDLHETDIALPEEYMGETLAYVLMSEHDSFPPEGTEISFEEAGKKLTIIVQKAHDNVIEKVVARFSDCK